MTRLWQAAFVFVALGGTAQAQTDALEGVWKRLSTKDAKTERFYQLTAKEGAISGKLLNPPFKTMACSLDLKLEGDRLRGKANWSEGKHKAQTAWSFQLKDGNLTGTSELIDWEDGVVYSRQKVRYTLVRVKSAELVAALKKAGMKVEDMYGAVKELGYTPEGLITSGSAEEAFGEDPGDLGVLNGGWLGPGGAWAVKASGDGVTLTPVGHSKEVSISLKNDRGTLRGNAKLAGGKSCAVELGYDKDEKVLGGRCAWKAGPYQGWAPLKLTRLGRTEGGSGKAERPTKSEGELAGVYKRDDGLYLRVRQEGGGMVGVLSDKKGKAECRVQFELKKGIWVGLANWKGMETTWELGVNKDGLTGRCQWVDVHEGKVIARGWSGRTFKRLKRLH